MCKYSDNLYYYGDYNVDRASASVVLEMVFTTVVSICFMCTWIAIKSLIIDIN